jgi:hypothetical protein
VIAPIETSTSRKAGTQEKDAKKCLKHGIDDIYDIPFGML